MSTPTPFRDYLAAKLEERGLDRKSLAKRMSSNPGKFYRRFDRWMKPSSTGAPAERVPDLQTLKRLAETLSVEPDEVLVAVRAQLALDHYQMDDKGRIRVLPPQQRPPPFQAELAWLESLIGCELEPDLRGATDLTATTLRRLAGWQQAPNVFERLLSEQAFDADWYLAFGGLLQLDGWDAQEITLFAWLRPNAIRAPVLMHRHGFGFVGFVAQDIPAAMALLERGDDPADYRILAPADAALRDLSRAGWIVHRLWPGAPERLLCSGQRPEAREVIDSALRDPFAAADTPAMLYWLCRSAIDDGEHPASLAAVAAESPSRWVTDALALGALPVSERA